MMLALGVIVLNEVGDPSTAISISPDLYVELALGRRHH